MVNLYITYRDTGTKARLRSWSRGFLFTCTGNGIIKHFAPLYKAENPTQVIYYPIIAVPRFSHLNYHRLL